MKNNKKVIAAFVCLLTVVSFFVIDLSTSQASEANVASAIPLTDCAVVLADFKGISLTPNTLAISLKDNTNSTNTSNVTRLISPACIAMYGALKTAEAKGLNVSWLNHLPVTLVESIKGQTVQAEFTNNLGKSKPSIQITKGLLSSYGDDEIIWLLGHELGHGVVGDSALRKSIYSLGIIFTVVSGLTFFVKNRKRLKALALGFFIVGLLFVSPLTVCLSKNDELKSDKFGIEVMANAGLGFIRAKDAATKFFLPALNQEEDDWFTCFIPNFSVHPSTKERLEKIKNITEEEVSTSVKS